MAPELNAGGAREDLLRLSRERSSGQSRAGLASAQDKTSARSANVVLRWREIRIVRAAVDEAFIDPRCADRELLMKLAYYIAAHHKPYQFNWIYSTIPDDGESTVLLHVDKKAAPGVFEQIGRLAASRRNVTMMPRRSISWSGWTQVENELRAIRMALAQPEWRYFVYLSGQCYPAKSRAEIEDMLASSWPNTLMRCWTFDKVRELEPQDPHLAKTAYLDLGGRIRKLPFTLPETKLDMDYKGSTWHALTREFCEWLVGSEAARRIARYLQFAFCPDEIFFQACAMNSPFKHKLAEDAARYFVFPGPKTMRQEDLSSILNSNAMYARKFDAEVDRSVLESLATKLGYPVV